MVFPYLESELIESSMKVIQSFDLFQIGKQQKIIALLYNKYVLKYENDK